MTIDEMIAVLQAARAGKPIQFKAKGDPTNQWCDGNTDGMGWSFSAHDYRVKPEPREFWLCNGRSKAIWVVTNESHDTANCGGDKILVREVIP